MAKALVKYDNKLKNRKAEPDESQQLEEPFTAQIKDSLKDDALVKYNNCQKWQKQEENLKTLTSTIISKMRSSSIDLLEINW